MKKHRSSRGPIGRGRFPFLYFTLLACLSTAGIVPVSQAAPEGGIVRAGSAQIIGQGSTTLIQQSSPRAIIDWRSFGIQPNEQVRFAQPSTSSSILNRVTGGQVSLIFGRMDANGQVLLINPNGIIFGQGAQINVGSLIASTANISNDNFMQGRLVFDQPGSPGAGIVNSGSITAAAGGLVALVAPHVRNDGVIQARLGKVILGAADTFTIDLYGDGLINLALTDSSLTQLKDMQGLPIKSLITQAGVIDVGSGQAVLVTADAAKGVLDSLINMSGTILADSAVQEGGRILLLARGGSADVSGGMSARGTTGGQIEVLGSQVHLFPTAELDASGLYGGGTLQIGGAYRGNGDTYRSRTTLIDAGATLNASALSRGSGGEVIVWSDGDTSYAGSILARGGAQAGDGGLVEVSGRQGLSFNGLVDAGAAYGNAGSLLLDPYDFTIGITEATLIDRVLRTGTSTFVSASNNINVNYAIDGRGRYQGGGLTLSAGNSININEYIVTNSGAINLYAGTGSINLAPGKVVYAGWAPITVQSGADLYNAPYLTAGPLTLISTQGSVYINQGIDSSIGNLFIRAARDVVVNQPIVSMNDGNSVDISAGSVIRVNAQIDGRPALGSNPSGAVTMVAGQDIYLYRSILAQTINLTAGLGTIYAPTMKTDVTLDADGIPIGNGLFAGNGAISVTAGSDLSSGIYVTTGPVSIRSTGGHVNIDTKLAEILGNVTIRSDVGSVNVGEEIANIRSGSNLAITAGADVNLNRQIDALDDTNPRSIVPVPGGAVTFTAGNSINLSKDLVTYNGPVNMTATTGTLNIGWDAVNDRTNRVQAGTAPITVITGGDLSTGPAPPVTFPRNAALYPTAWDNVVGELKRYVAFGTTGKLSLTSTGGNVTVDAPIPDTTGEVALTAGNAILVKHKVFNNGQPITLTAGPGGITVYNTNDSYGLGVEDTPAIATSGTLTLRAEGDISAGGKGIVSMGKLTIDTRSRLLGGSVFQNWHYRPNEIELIADLGINSFYAGFSPKITATSSSGAIYLGVDQPGQLIINAPSPTAGDVFTGGWLGANVTINAGRDINLSNVSPSGVLKLTAGRDANLNTFEVFSLDVAAVRNIHFGGAVTVPFCTNCATVWIDGGDLKAVSTGGSINFGSAALYSSVYIGNGKNFLLDAYGDVELGILQTFGPVSITAQTGNITLRNDIGPPIPVIDPGGIGVASLLLDAGSNIIMQGAKAAGTVTITAGGSLTPAKGIFSGTANGVTISTGGTALEKRTAGDVLWPAPFSFNGTSFGDIVLDVQQPLNPPGSVLPAITPGPAVSPPGLPGALTALPAQPPGMVSVSGSGTPGSSGSAEGTEQKIDPLQATGSGVLSEIIPGEEEGAAEDEEQEEEKRKTQIKLSGGRGAGQSTDFGWR
jgi:filamentous hemagglutinin family protein